MYRTAFCLGCRDFTIELTLGKDEKPLMDWRQVHPIGANRGSVPTDVPDNVSLDHIEACNVLPISAKAWHDRRRRNCGGECARLSSENLAGARC
jgi:hypothetical protein